MVQVKRRDAADFLMALALVALGLSACGSAPPVPSDRFYSLEPTPLPGPAGAPAPATLLVNPLGARGFLGGRQIVYRTREEPRVVQRYDALLWADPPPGAVSRALAEGLQAAEVFQLVAVPADRARADYLLGGELERFEHLPTDRPPRVAVAFNLVLVRADTREAILSRRYAGEEPVDGDVPEAMVAAFDRLLARLVAESARDLQTLKPRLDRTRSP